MRVALFCTSCSTTVHGETEGEEQFYQAKSRMREDLGAHCPRRIGRDRCPMRSKNTPTQPGADIEL